MRKIFFFLKEFVNEKRIYSAKSSVSRIQTLRTDLLLKAGKGNAGRFGEGEMMTFKPDDMDDQQNHHGGHYTGESHDAAASLNDMVSTLTGPITEATGEMLKVTQELLDSIADTMVGIFILFTI